MTLTRIENIMTKTSKLVASLAAVGALCVGTIAVAAPWHHEPTPPAPNAANPAECMTGMTNRMADGYASLGSILTLKDNQKKAWDKYVQARLALMQPVFAPDQKMPVDVQGRLELRKQSYETRASRLQNVINARAELFKVLSVEQKYVLESHEMKHRGHGHSMPRGPMGPQAGRHCM